MAEKTAKTAFVAGWVVRCVRANGKGNGLLVEGALYTVIHVTPSGSLELAGISWPNPVGVKYWDCDRFEHYTPMDSAEYDDTLAGQAIYRDMEGGNG